MSDKPCPTCGGTGWELLANSWFTQDGYRRSKCWCCEGTGIRPANYRDFDGSVAFNAKARKLVAEWGGLTPPPELCDPQTGAYISPS